MFCINVSSHPVRLREGIYASTVLQPGQSLEVGGLAERTLRHGGGDYSHVEHWGLGLMVEDDPECQRWIAATLAAMKATADGELAASGVAGTATAEHRGLRFRVMLPAGADLVAVESKLRETSGFGPAALEVLA